MLLEVGRIEKAHGLHGEVVVRLTTNVEDRVAAGSVLFTDPGGARRLDVESSRPHQHRWIVRLAGVASREAADELHGVPIYAEALTEAEPDVLWAHELVGSEVREPDGRSRGRVVSLIDNPASDLLELEDGALVPLRFVVERSPGLVVVDVPAGLFET